MGSCTSTSVAARASGHAAANAATSPKLLGATNAAKGAPLPLRRSETAPCSSARGAKPVRGTEGTEDVRISTVSTQVGVGASLSSDSDDDDCCEALVEALEELDRTVERATACYRQACFNKEAMNEESLRTADQRLHRIQAKIKGLKRVRYSCSWHVGDDPKEHSLEGTLWESLYEGRTLGFRHVVDRVLIQNRVVSHWQSQKSLAKGPTPAASPPSASSRSPSPTFRRSARPEVSVRDWGGVDIFQVDRQLGRPLSSVFKSIWRVRPLDGLCRTPFLKAMEFVGAVEDTYKEVPYHNRIHAADVTQGVFYLWSQLSSLSSMKGFFSLTDMLVLVLAAMVHDVAHPAVSNDFLTKTWDALSLRYNDRSVLENFHAATGFELMHKTGARLLDINHRGMLGPSEGQLRMRVIDMILATDMAQHKQVVESMVAELDVHSNVQDIDKLVLEKHVLHLSDLGHPLRPAALHQEWTRRVTEEFFAQGDREKALGLSPMALYDRDMAPSAAKSQVGFVSFVVVPTWRPLQRILGDAGAALDACLKSNLEEWQAESAREDLEAQKFGQSMEIVNKSETR